MDTNTVFAFLIAIVLALVISAVDEGLILLLIGFLIIPVAWNLSSIFSIDTTASSLGGWGILIVDAYWFLSAFCFGKVIVTYPGFENYFKRSKHERN